MLPGRSPRKRGPIDAKHREGILNYAVLKSRQHKYDQAESILLKGVNLYPEYPEYYKNLYWIYALHSENRNEDAIIYGDLFLKSAKQGDVAIIRIRSNMKDLLARFPELSSDTLEIVKTETPIFIPRNH